MLFAAHLDVRVSSLGRKLIQQRLQSREALLVALVRSSQRLRLRSKRGAGVDVDAIHRLQVFLDPWSRDCRVGSNNDRDNVFYGREACVLLLPSAVVVGKVHVCDLPKLDLSSPAPAGTNLCAAADLLLLLLVVLAPCRTSNHAAMTNRAQLGEDK